VKAAVEAGYRHIDTAWVYFNEKEIGEALKEIFAAGKIKREDLFITTKLHSVFFHKEDVEKTLREQLAALGLAYVDLYLVHSPMATKRDPNNPMAAFPADKDGLDNVDHLETWSGMEQCFKKGLAKAIGVSNYNSRQLQRLYDHATIKPHNLQVECHAYWPQFELHDFCKKLNISFTGYSPIGSPGLAVAAKGMGVAHFPVLVEDPVVINIAKKHHKTPAQVLLRWHYERDMIVIPKSTNPKRIKENFDIFNFSLDKADHEALGKLKKGRLLEDGFKMFESHPEFPFHEAF
jgi:diketogulonate reductase-like aldo/keto reductase